MDSKKLQQEMAQGAPTEAPSITVLEEEIAGLDSEPMVGETVEEEPGRKELADRLKIAFFNKPHVFKALRISPEIMDQMSVAQLKQVELMFQAAMYGESNKQLLSGLLNVVNYGVGKFFGVSAEKLNNNEELKDSFVNSPVAFLMLSRIPPMVMPFLRYSMAILNLKIEEKKNFPPPSIASQSEQPQPGDRPSNLHPDGL